MGRPRSNPDPRAVYPAAIWKMASGVLRSSTAPRPTLDFVWDGNRLHERVPGKDRVEARLVAPGAPVFHALLVSGMDPRSADYLVSLPQKYLCNAAAVQLAHAWGVPALAGTFGLDAAEPATWHAPWLRLAALWWPQ